MSDKKEVKFKPGVGIDVGTSNIVLVRQTEDGTFVNKFHRNMLYPLDITDESADLLERSNYFFIKVSDKYYVIGEDALNLVNAIGKGNIIRPMKDGILNPSLKESSDLLFFIIKSIVGEPIIPNEPLRFTVPANPIDRDIDNLFHQMVLSSFFTKLGYSPKAVNESMCIVYDCNPIMKSEEDVPLSGIATSWGAGMVNVAMSFKGLSVIEFSCTKSGDNIDEQTEKVTGISKSKIIKIKEKKLDLDNIDMSDRVQAALSIYYDETIDRVVHHISEKFKEKGSEMDGEIEWIIAGGTSMVKGFGKRIEQSIKKAKLPFNIYRIRHSETPFFSVGQGACIRAQADYMKEKNK
jgi:actin-like ATPase involved in cell morphogenesis